MSQRVVNNLNEGLHRLFASDRDVCLIGEDIDDPYGGAFKVTRGLATNYPDRVFPSPISEQSIVSIANGMALAGDKPIVEVMFGDFLMLAFDQILNVASKIPEMTGELVPHEMIIRSPCGAHRGYGSTHSQSLQKHFVGIPNVVLYEMSPFHDNFRVFSKMFFEKQLAIYFENKILYSKNFLNLPGDIDVFRTNQIDSENDFVCLSTSDRDQFDTVILCGGGLAYDVMAVAKELLIEMEMETMIIVPSKIFPLEIEPIGEFLKQAKQIVVVEESVAGGTWGDTIAANIYSLIWSHLKKKILLINSIGFSIPSARHLEELVVVNQKKIKKLWLKEFCDG